MSQEIYIQLEEKRKHLKQLGNKVANLSLNYPDIIDSSDLSFRLEKLRQVYLSSGKTHGYADGMRARRANEVREVLAILR